MSKNKTIIAANGIGISLVVLGHSTGTTPAQQDEILLSSPAFAMFLEAIRLIYTFHMPLFFFLSGFLYRFTGSSFQLGFGRFAKKKAIRLLLPYLVLTSLVYPLKVYLSRYALRPIQLGWDEYLTALVIPWQNPIIFFWFLPSLFLMLIVAKCVFREQRQPVVDTLILTATIPLFFIFDQVNTTGWTSVLNIGGVLHNAIFFVSGFYFATYYRSAVLEPSWIGAVLFFISAPLFFLGPKAGFSADVLVLLNACAGIYASIFAASRLQSVFQLPGRNAYQIYLLSWFPQLFVRVLCGQVLEVNIWICVLLMFVTGLFVPILIVWTCKRFDRSRITRTILQY